MSPILLRTFVEIIEGTYNVANHASVKRKLKVADQLVEFEFQVVAQAEEEKSEAASQSPAAAQIDTSDSQVSPLVSLQNLEFNEPTGVALDMLTKFKRRYLEINDLEDSAICLDLVMMATELVACVDKKISDIEKLTATQFLDTNLQSQINDLVNEAKGCSALCNFCHRKCELKPHSQHQKHSCDRLGHQMRVFGGGFLTGPSGKYPSLKVCDEIDANTTI